MADGRGGVGMPIRTVVKRDLVDSRSGKGRGGGGGMWIGVLVHN